MDKEITQKFEVTENHLKLLKEMYISWDDCEFGAPCIDPKRPYGNSYVEGDILNILGIKPKKQVSEDDWEYSYPQEKMAIKIHSEMQTVLQILVSNLKIETGTYEASKYSTDWKKAE